MHDFEVIYYVQGIAGQLSMVVRAARRQDAEAAVRAAYAVPVTIHRVVRLD